MGYWRFRRFWQAAFVRDHELQHGLIEPYEKAPEAFHQGQFSESCLLRAERLAGQLRWQQLEQHWHWQRRLMLLLFALLVVIAGISLSNALLALASPISLLHGWVSLVGVNLLMLLLWLGALARGAALPGVGGFAISGSQRWRWLRSTRALTRSWLHTMQQQRLLSPALSAMSHGFWLALLSTAWLVLLIRLSTQAYSFTWETTILTTHQLQQVALWLGYLPQLFGFEAPPVQALLESSNASAQQQAGRWLLVVLFCYGIAPRAFLLMVAVVTLLVRYRRLHIATDDAHYAAMQRCWQQLNDANQRIVDADAGQPDRPQASAATDGKGRFLLSLDHEPAAQLPNWATELDNLGVVATGSDKRRILAQFAQQAAAVIVVRLDPQLSPDRGSLEFVRALQPLTQRLLLCSSRALEEPSTVPSSELWRSALAQLPAVLLSSAETEQLLTTGVGS